MKRLRRSRSDRILAGVCGGIGATYRVNADLVRVLWLVSLVMAGVGVLPYLAAVFLLPEDETGRSVPAPLGKMAGFSLLFLGILLLFRTFEARVLDPMVLAFWKFQALGPILLLVCGSLLVWPRARAFLLATGRRPRRSVSDRVLGGVAGGIAAEMGVDPNVVRLVFVGAAGFTFGLAVLLYVLLVAVMPEEPSVASPLSDQRGPLPPPPAEPGGADMSPPRDQAPGGLGR